MYTTSVLLFWLATMAALITVYGRIEGIPEVLEEYRPESVPGILNYQLRVSLTVYDTARSSAAPRKYPVNQDYTFEILGLEANHNYSLLIHLTDFIFNGWRYQISTGDNSIPNELKDTKVALDDFVKGVNRTTAVLGTQNEPLILTVIGSKQYYERASSSAMELLMNSPLGPVFRSKWLTILFCTTVVMMIAPKLIQILAPDLAKSLNEAQQEAYRERLQEKQAKAVQPQRK